MNVDPEAIASTRYTMRWHLAQTLILAVISIALAVPVLTYAITTIQLESHFRRQALSASLIAARQGVFTFLGAPSDVASSDASRLRELIGAEYLEFIDGETNQTIARSGTAQPAIDLTAAWTAAKYTAPTLIRETRDAWHIAVPVVTLARNSSQSRIVDDPTPTPIGLLYIRYTKSSVSQLVHTVTTISGIISICLMSAVIIWGSKRLGALTRPLNALSSVMRNAATGVRAAEDGPQEIATIACVYNGLMDRIDRHRDNLEATVAARTAALNEALGVAQQLERFKTYLLSSSTHEMKTPLHLIELAVRRSLHDLEFIPDTSGIREAQRTILLAAGELMSRIQKTLLRATIQGEFYKLTLVQVKTSEFANRLSERFTPMATSQGNSLLLDVAGAAEMTVDDEKFYEVACELVQNSCKFTHDGTITIRLHVGHMIELQVIDDGCGIAPEEEGLIWVDFCQGTPSTGHNSKHPGSGMGLPLVRWIVAQMRGTVSVETAIGRGTCVTVSIPSIEPSQHLHMMETESAP